MRRLLQVSGIHFIFCFVLQGICWLTFLIVMPLSVHGLSYSAHFSKFFSRVKQTSEIDFQDILLFLVSGATIKTLLIFVLTFPVVYWIYQSAELGRLRKFTRISISSIVLLVTYILFCLSWCPPIFADTLKLTSSFIFDGYLLFPYSLLWLFIAGITLFLTHSSAIKNATKAQTFMSILFLLLPYALFVRDKVPPSNFKLALPDKSIVMLWSDSFRSDYLNKSFTPHLSDAQNELQATALKGLVTPSESTVTALAALFTGKLPHESGIINSYSAPIDFSKNSLINDLKEKGYCTIGLAHYSNNALVRNEYGFDLHRDILSDYRIKYLSYFLLKRDPILISALSFDLVYQASPDLLHSAYDFISAVPNSLKLFRETQKFLSACGTRPVFAFLFFQAPHFEHPVTFPQYLKTPFEKRRYSILSNYYSYENKQKLMPFMSEFYAASVRELDTFITGMIRDNLTGPHDNSKTFLFGADHGEYLGEDGHYLHAETLGPLVGGAVPFVAFGMGRELFRSLEDIYLQNTEIRKSINAIVDEVSTKNSLHSAFLYRESEIWPWGEQLPLNFKRVPYPDAWDGLLKYSANGMLILDEQYKEITEYAKHRQWIVGSDIYDVYPQEGRQHLIKKNQQLIPKKELPTFILEMLQVQSPQLMRELK